jgi:hypothetical protein
MEQNDTTEEPKPIVRVAGRFDSKARARSGGNLAMLILAAVVSLLLIAGALLLILQNVFVAAPK